MSGGWRVTHRWSDIYTHMHRLTDIHKLSSTQFIKHTDDNDKHALFNLLYDF